MSTTIRRREPLLSRMARNALEIKLLGHLVAVDDGSLTFGEICLRFPGQPVSKVLEGLIEDRQVERFPGCVFHVTTLGRSRLAPPVCVSEVPMANAPS